MAMLLAIDETLAQKARNEELILPDQGKAESVKTLWTTGESQTPQDLNAWVQARRHLPTFERHGHPRKSRITFAVEGSISYKWKKQEAYWEEGSVQAVGGISAGRLIQQEGDLDRRPNQARPPTLRSRSTAGKSSSRKHGETVERCMLEGRERKGAAQMALANYARCRKGCCKDGGTGDTFNRRKRMNSTAQGRAAGGGKRQRLAQASREHQRWCQAWMARPFRMRGTNE